ncbi:hypothetical protein [Phenylobacterium sp.]|uniref:hypothetical protein n=1 Tax=Phenylobacterium sp. TaxID=1871053 RepID=UPI0025DE5D8C|nr:hypothetical protein [Phenylobacterium sp.]MBX3485907.1 hypothetical protein [Phenylobacterium sp.]MCW5758224.1 hypothetical protein [Phenylobacterium sp.]
MRFVDSIYYGRVDGTVLDVIASGSLDLFGISHVQITSLDSVSNVAQSVPAKRLSATSSNIIPLSGSLVIPLRDLQNCKILDDIFVGFDEIWCYSVVPTERPNESANLVGPLDLAFDELSGQRIDCFKRLGCISAFGDGFGLNYITLNDDLAKIIESQR